MMTIKKTQFQPYVTLNHFHIQWHITDDCNMRCSHCYQSGYSKANDMNFQKLKEIADSIANSLREMRSRCSILITGGEPLLKKETMPLLSYLSEKKEIKSIGIITNGTLLNNYIAQLSSLKKFSIIYISLDGLTPHTNALIREDPKHFSAVTSVLPLIHRKKLKAVILYTLMRSNINDIYNVFKFAKQYTIDGIILEKYVPIGTDNKRIHEVVTRDELRKLYDFLLAECSCDNSKSFSYRALQITFRKKPSVKAALCIAGNDGCAIMPDGTVYPCRRMPIPIGNIKEKTLSDMFDTIFMSSLQNRSNLSGKCRQCNIDYCYGCRAMSYALFNDALRHDPHCWK